MGKKNNSIKNYPDVLSAKMVSEILNINVKTVYSLIKEEKVKAQKIGREYRITKKNFLSFLNNND